MAHPQRNDAGPNAEATVAKSFGFREVVFSFNCFIAAMLALWFAFRLDLRNPWWAMQRSISPASRCCPGHYADMASSSR